MARQKLSKELDNEVVKEENVMTNEVQLNEVQSEIDLAVLELNRINLEIEQKKRELEASNLNKPIPVSEKVVSSLDKKRGAAKVIEAQKAYDNQMVTGRFFNQRNPGQKVRLTYIKYDDDPVKWYDFDHNGVYTIKRGFANQINEHYYTPQFTKKTDIQEHSPTLGDNSAIAEVKTDKKKYAFVPIEF